jgi:hypothetical protein
MSNPKKQYIVGIEGENELLDTITHNKVYTEHDIDKLYGGDVCDGETVVVYELVPVKRFVRKFQEIKP